MRIGVERNDDSEATWEFFRHPIWQLFYYILEGRLIRTLRVFEEINPINYEIDRSFSCIFLEIAIICDLQPL